MRRRAPAGEAVSAVAGHLVTRTLRDGISDADLSVGGREQTFAPSIPFQISRGLGAAGEQATVRLRACS